MTPASLIVCRERERARLRQLLDKAVAGPGQLILLSREARIGRTTLFDDAIKQANERGPIRLLLISPGTVTQRLRSVYNKLGVNSRAAAVARWAELKSD